MKTQKSPEISPSSSSNKQEKSKVKTTDHEGSSSHRRKLSSSQHDRRSSSRHRSKSKEDKLNRKTTENSAVEETASNKSKINRDNDSTTGMFLQSSQSKTISNYFQHMTIQLMRRNPVVDHPFPHQVVNIVENRLLITIIVIILQQNTIDEMMIIITIIIVVRIIRVLIMFIIIITIIINPHHLDIDIIVDLHLLVLIIVRDIFLPHLHRCHLHHVVEVHHLRLVVHPILPFLEHHLLVHRQEIVIIIILDLDMTIIFVVHQLWKNYFSKHPNRLNQFQHRKIPINHRHHHQQLLI